MIRGEVSILNHLRIYDSQIKVWNHTEINLLYGLQFVLLRYVACKKSSWRVKVYQTSKNYTAVYDIMRQDFTTLEKSSRHQSFHPLLRQSQGKQQKYSVHVTKYSTMNVCLHVLDRLPQRLAGRRSILRCFAVALCVGTRAASTGPIQISEGTFFFTQCSCLSEGLTEQRECFFSFV